MRIERARAGPREASRATRGWFVCVTQDPNSPRGWTSDGFQIAEADLKIRGPGEFLGTRQHGRLPDLRIADLTRDVKLLALAREAALDYVRLDPELRRSPALARAVKARWGERLRLSGVG